MEWLKLEHAHTVATGQGFKPIEVPWIVSRDISKITHPPGGIPVLNPNVPQTHDKHFGDLIGSGEQGFLAIWDKLLPDKKYVTTTPCFRAEPAYTEGITEPWFMKTELIWVQPACDPENALYVVMNLAKRIMGCWVRKFDEVRTEDGIDLYVGGLEVGSYGIRMSDPDKLWVYGTGLAEPRFTTALRRIKEVITLTPKTQRVTKP